MSDFLRGKAWRAGYDAALSGKPRNGGRRQRGTIFYDDWIDGYDDGERSLSAAALKGQPQ